MPALMVLVARQRALDGSGGDEHREVDRGSADGRGHGKPNQPHDQRPLTTEDVADSSAEQEKAAEGERVGRHYPLAIGVGEVRVRAGP